MASWRFWLIMMIGAWIAARQESSRFSRMYGNGSNGLLKRAEVSAIQPSSTPPNRRMNTQLPPNSAILVRSPLAQGELTLEGGVHVAADRLLLLEAADHLRLQLRQGPALLGQDVLDVLCPEAVEVFQADETLGVPVGPGLADGAVDRVANEPPGHQLAVGKAGRRSGRPPSIRL